MGWAKGSIYGLAIMVCRLSDASSRALAYVPSASLQGYLPPSMAPTLSSLCIVNGGDWEVLERKPDSHISIDMVLHDTYGNDNCIE
jgi:hypothetical protein